MKKRVVVTGMGVITSLGMNVQDFWVAIKQGKSGINTIKKFDTENFSTKVAAEINNFEPNNFMDRKESKRMDRYTQFAMAAAKMGMEEARIDSEKTDNNRMGVIIGSGIGGIETLEDQHEVLINRGPGRVSPFFIPMMIANMASGRIAIQFGAKGFNECVVTACATGTNSIGDAFKVIQRGDADIMITGGSEAPITPLSLPVLFNESYVYQLRPIDSFKTFDLERDGFIIGEGAGILILEEFEHAIKRGANILGKLLICLYL